ncbi:MAG: SDR family NAD(P)-dependent oxidoreductase, partial [Caulobacteraceae bacterium]
MARAALVTGAARRIGRRLALECAACSYDVAVHCHASEDDAAEVVAEIEGLGRKAAVLRADLAVESETAALIGQAVEAVGPLTLLVNNASAFRDDRVGSLSRASWDAHIETNLRAPIVLAEAFAGQLPASKDGLIVNILDQRVLSPEPEF